MIQRYNTKKLIAESLMNLMLANSIDDITVQDITNNCGISRRTFYYHFSDKYALVDWIYETEAVDFINLIGEGSTWYDAVLAKLNIIKRNPGFYKKIYRQNWFINSFSDVTRRLYIDAVAKNIPDGINKKLEFMIDFYVNACVKMTSTWVLNGLKESPEELVAGFLSCLPDELKKYLITDEDLEKAYANAKSNNYQAH